MDQGTIQEINQYLVQIFNEVLVIEEDSLRQSEFSDLTIKEMHTIEAIGLEGVNNASVVAEKLSLTKGTVSVSINNLVRKGYVDRDRDKDDRRIVTLKLTKKGKLLFRLHRKFHLDMVRDTLVGLQEDEALALLKGVRNLHNFLNRVKENME